MKDLKTCRILVTPTSFGRGDPTLKTELEAQVGEIVYNTTGRPLTSADLAMSPGWIQSIAPQYLPPTA
jgi:hypothetical protein